MSAKKLDTIVRKRQSTIHYYHNASIFVSRESLQGRVGFHLLLLLYRCEYTIIQNSGYIFMGDYYSRLTSFHEK